MRIGVHEEGEGAIRIKTRGSEILHICYLYQHKILEKSHQSSSGFELQPSNTPPPIFRAISGLMMLVLFSQKFNLLNKIMKLDSQFHLN